MTALGIFFTIGTVVLGGFIIYFLFFEKPEEKSKAK